MYGQKQIIQCAAVAVILFVLSFHRSIIKRNKEIARAKLRSKILHQLNEISVTDAHGDDDELAFNRNLTGYCLKNPFGTNIYGNYDNNVVRCHHICFDQFETWLHRQCKGDCCVPKRRTFNTCQLNIDSLRKSKTFHSKGTRTHETKALAVYSAYDVEKSAGLYTGNQQQQQKRTQHPFELIKAISVDSINEQLTNRLHLNQSNEYECQNPHFNQVIRKNTTSVKVKVKVNQIKLETNLSQQIMEYHEFLFDMGRPEMKPLKSSASNDFARIFVSIFAMLSLVAALIAIRYMIKIFFHHDHVESMIRNFALRQALQARMEQILEENRTQRPNQNNDEHSNNKKNESSQIENDIKSDDQSDFDRVE